MAKNKVGREGFNWFILPYHFSSLKELRTGTQPGKNLEAGAGVESMEVIVGVCLTGMLHMAFSTCFLVEPRISISEIAWTLPH